MKCKNNLWGYILFLIIGALVCYISLQFSLFKIDLEINIPEFLVNAGTACIGIYIAHTIQKNINKNQNQYSYIETKLDVLWTSFNNFSQTFIYDDKIEVANYSRFEKDICYPIVFIKSIFTSFDLKIENIEKLDDFLNTFDSIIDRANKEDNIIYFGEQKAEIEEQISKINLQFSTILKELQDL